jgi:hypothetical protein
VAQTARDTSECSIFEVQIPGVLVKIKVEPVSTGSLHLPLKEQSKTGSRLQLSQRHPGTILHLDSCNRFAITYFSSIMVYSE